MSQLLNEILNRAKALSEKREKAEIDGFGEMFEFDFSENYSDEAREYFALTSNETAYLVASIEHLVERVKRAERVVIRTQEYAESGCIDAYNRGADPLGDLVDDALAANQESERAFATKWNEK